MRGIKFLIIALCIFKVIDAAPAAQADTTYTTPPETPPTETSPEISTPSQLPPQTQNANLNFPISGNGTCGVAIGSRCPDGFCCSAGGSCGETPEHCQTGCQEEYGVCGVPDSIRNVGFQFNTCTENNTLAITFDDGPQEITETLLDNLKERNVKATFFMNGHAYQNHCIYDYAPIVQRAFKEGHQLASHTWSHPHLPLLSEEEIRYQIEFLEVAFKKIIGAIPTYFRPPFGERYGLVQNILREKGYKMIIWDLDTNDFKEDLQLATDLYNTQMAKLPEPNPHIILNHDRVVITSTTLAPFEVDDALKRGYKVTTVGDCIGKPDKDDWYRDIGKPEKRDDTWKCTIEDMHGSSL